MALRFFGRSRNEEAPQPEEPPAPPPVTDPPTASAEPETPAPARRSPPRRRGTSEGPLEDPQPDVIAADFPESEASRRRRRRRARPRPDATAEASEAPAAADQPEVAAVPAETEAGAEGEAAPRRRRRRGGSGSGSNGQPAATPPPETPAPPQPGRKEQQQIISLLENLVARQNVILDTTSSREINTLRSLERSIQVLTQRLGGEYTMSSQGGALPKVGIFVDVPNIMYAAERLGVTVDFGKLLAQLTRGRSLVRASAYAPISDDPQIRLESQKFVAPFVNHGYRIVTKPLKRFADGSIKANFDVELAMDVLTMSDRLDVVSLVSGDGDFRRLSELVASKGVRVEVVAFGQSTAGELRAVADEYVDLTEHLEELAV